MPISFILSRSVRLAIHAGIIETLHLRTRSRDGAQQDQDLSDTACLVVDSLGPRSESKHQTEDDGAGRRLAQSEPGEDEDTREGAVGDQDYEGTIRIRKPLQKPVRGWSAEGANDFSFKWTRSVLTLGITRPNKDAALRIESE